MKNKENKYKTKIINKKEKEIESTIYGYRIDDLHKKISFEDLQLLLLLRGNRFNDFQKKIYKLINFLLLTNGLEDVSVLAASNSVVGGGIISSSLISKIASSSGIINGSKEIEIIIKILDDFNGESIVELVNKMKNIKDNSEFTVDIDIVGFRKINNEENIIEFIRKETATCENSLFFTSLFLKNKENINKMGYYFSKILLLCLLAKDMGLGRNEIILMININSLYLSSILALEQKEYGIEEFPFYLKELKKNRDIDTNFKDGDYFL